MQVLEWPIIVEGLIRDRWKLEEVTNEHDAHAAKEVGYSAGKDLAESFIDPRKLAQTQHALLIDHEISNVPQLLLDSTSICRR